MILLTFISFFALANVQDYRGAYISQGESLGCAKPPSPKYKLVVEQRLTPLAKAGELGRVLEVKSSSDAQGGIRFSCVATYEGKYVFNNNKVVGDLARTKCNCGALDQRTSERLCQRGDIFVVEPANTPSRVSLTGDTVVTQQLRPVPGRRGLPGCGKSFPVFTFKRF